MNVMQRINTPPADAPKRDFRSGDVIKVNYRIEEGGKTRVQVFQGTVIAIRGAGMSRTFTVRKESFNVGVERIFPMFSPHIESIEVVERRKVRRAKNYVLRA